jgi:hypothetical protein
VGKRPQEICDGWQTREATDICHELGLGPLLEKMSAGMVQMVVETGWQLPHGERSRLFIACALLRRADILVLYESSIPRNSGWVWIVCCFGRRSNAICGSR